VGVWPRRLLAITACGVGLAACGSAASAPPTTTSTSTTIATVTHFTYGPLPSASARMLCRDETQEDIAEVLGVTPVTDPTSTWVNHKYTCPYVYSDGAMVLSVKELPTIAATLAYEQYLGRTLGNTGAVANVGQGGFTTTNGSVVTRKDNKILLVEIGGLPANFGKPATTRAEVALTVTDIILACWRGD
jgi:hypothetical protein